MQLSELIDKPVTLRQKQFIGPSKFHDVVVTVLRVYDSQIKCRLDNGTIYIPKKYFFDYQADPLNKIFYVPTWFSFTTKEDLEAFMKKNRVA